MKKKKNQTRKLKKKVWPTIHDMMEIKGKKYQNVKNNWKGKKKD